MIAGSSPRIRRGITLTEILIAILIMGVGLISLATLFPLGLLRLRTATQYARAGLTYETAADDMDSRALFLKSSFHQTWYGPRDPFVQDIDNTGNIKGIIASGSASVPANNVGLATGLPFCYDPLWRAITGVVPGNALADPTLALGAYNAVDEARFGAGVFGGSTYPYLRADPGDGGTPSAYGLQRITNFIPWSTANLTPQYPFLYNNPSVSGDGAGNVFSSIDDIVYNPTGGTANSPSSVLPDMSLGVPQADYRFTWFVTGRQLDAGGNGAQFVGDVVVCDGRPFGFDSVSTPSGTVSMPTGEVAVEAIFAYGSNVLPIVAGGKIGFATGADKTVLLRWPITLADPNVRVGGWIADVTYERNVTTFANRSNNSATAFARCNWYQIGKRTDAQVDQIDNTYRSMVLTITSPVKARTMLNVPSGGNPPTPVNLNVALVMPSVVNVYARSFEVH